MKNRFIKNITYIFLIPLNLIISLGATYLFIIRGGKDFNSRSLLIGAYRGEDIFLIIYSLLIIISVVWYWKFKNVYGDNSLDVHYKILFKYYICFKLICLLTLFLFSIDNSGFPHF